MEVMRIKIVLLLLLMSNCYCLNAKEVPDTAKFVYVNDLCDTAIVQGKNDVYFILERDSAKLNEGNWQINMPWIAALLVGLLTVLANIVISKQYRKMSQEVVDKQLNTSKEISLAQIENERNNAVLEFNKTVLSGNRKEWIKQLRKIVSKILLITTNIKVKQSITADEHEKFRYLITKAELMLNSEKDKNFIQALRNLEVCSFEILKCSIEPIEIEILAEEVKEFARITLKNEWEKTKRGE